MKVQTVMLCLGITLVLSANAADTLRTGKLNGIATDSEGAIISNAIIFVHRDWPNEKTQDLSLTSDKTGMFSIDLAPGFYDVAVFAHAFSPHASKVRIRTSQGTNYAVKLSADPQMIAEFGDGFFQNPSVKHPP